LGAFHFSWKVGNPPAGCHFSMPKHSVFEGKSAHIAFEFNLREGLQLS